jgi:hypothetical protein
MSFTEILARSIATFEGFFKSGSLAQRNNNPGNLRSWGTRPVRDGYAVFDTPEAGWAALRRQIELNINRGLTLQEFFGGKQGVYAGYAPASDENDPAGYAQFVAQRAGIAADVPLAQYRDAGGRAGPTPILEAGTSPLPGPAGRSSQPSGPAGKGSKEGNDG